MTSRVFALSITCSALAIAALTTPAHAQSGAPQPVEAIQANDEVGDIVVTAQKRSESLQDVPISITAINAGTLARRGVGGTLDLQSVIPGFQTSQLNAAATPAIRSVGSTEPSAGNEGNVALYVDGVYYPSQYSGAFNFSDIERIEVLKGPQGTLFGRNATAGLVNIITRTPSAKTSGEFNAGYGNYGAFRASAYFTTGVVEDVAVSIAAIRSNQDKGWGRNLFNGQEAFKTDETGVRGKIYVTPGTNTKITIGGDYDKQHNDIGVAYQSTTLPRFTINDNLTPSGTTRDWGVSGKLEQDFGFASLVSTSAYRDNRSRFVVDQDRTPLGIVNADVSTKTHAFTQEVQLASDKSSKLVYILGGFYMDRVASVDPLTVAGLGVIAGTTGAPLPFTPYNSQSIFGTQKTRSLSAFGQLTYPIFEHTRVTAGLRYTSDRQAYDGTVVFTPVTAPPPTVTIPDPNSRSKTFSKLTYRFAVDQKIGSTLLYASYDRGFKSGFFNLQKFPTDSVEPEVLDSFQFGVKADFFDRRLRLDAAAFFYDYTNIQVVVIQNGAASELNAGSAKLNGYELNFTALPVHDLNITGGVTWLPTAHYGTFFPCPNAGADNCNDARINRSPKISAAMGVDYTVHSAIGEFTPSASLNYSSSFPWIPKPSLQTTPIFSENSYLVLNTSLSWRSASGHFSASIWAKNLTDTNYNAFASKDSFGNFTIVAPPQTYGGTIGFKF